jgi:hypothetical protein
MMRGIARSLRVLCLAWGLLLLAWLPASYVFYATASGPLSPTFSLGVNVDDGVLQCNWGSHSSRDSRKAHAWIGRLDFDMGGAKSPLWPKWLQIEHNSGTSTAIWLPLWLIAVPCLAWPVTSFILARRRHKPGFPVEPTDDSGSEAPKVRSNEAQGASPG